MGHLLEAILYKLLTENNPQDSEASSIGLRFVHQIEAGRYHDATRHRVRQRGPLLGEGTHEEEGQLHSTHNNVTKGARGVGGTNMRAEPPRKRGEIGVIVNKRLHAISTVPSHILISCVTYMKLMTQFSSAQQYALLLLQNISP